MPLDLGRIPFPDGYTQYTPPEKRRRRRRAELAGVKTERSVPSIHQALPGARTGTASAKESEDGGALTILPDTVAPRDIPFLLGATRDRLGGSAAASLAGHVIVGGFVALLVYLAPERVYPLVEPNRENYEGIVWLPQEGPGGGGGGGGNQSLELPRQAELQGADEPELSIPVEPEPDFVEPELEPETLQADLLSIPAVSVASADLTATGVFEGFSAQATLSQGTGTGGGAGTGQGTGIGPGDGTGLGPGQGGGVGGGVFRPGSGIVNPQLLREVKPQYTSEAMRAQVQGEVWLEVVVLPDGTVGDVTITKSLDAIFGLDEEAIRAAQQWRFRPGTRFGEPVAVLVGIALEFHLR